MPASAKTPFAAYIDYAAQIEPQLVLVGGAYNFEIEKTDAVSLAGISAQRPHIGCMLIERDTPYLFLLLRLSQPLDSFEACEVKIEKAARPISQTAIARTVYWRMHGGQLYSLPQKQQARDALQRFSKNARTELAVMQAQYNQRFNAQTLLDFFTASQHA